MQTQFTQYDNFKQNRKSKKQQFTAIYCSIFITGGSEMKAIDEKTGEIVDLGLGCIFGIFINLDFSGEGLPILTEKARKYLHLQPKIKLEELKKNHTL